MLAAEFEERRRRSTSTRAATPSSAAVTVVKDARDRIGAVLAKFLNGDEKVSAILILLPIRLSLWLLSAAINFTVSAC